MLGKFSYQCGMVAILVESEMNQGSHGVGLMGDAAFIGLCR